MYVSVRVFLCARMCVCVCVCVCVARARARVCVYMSVFVCLCLMRIQKHTDVMPETYKERGDVSFDSPLHHRG